MEKNSITDIIKRNKKTDQRNNRQNKQQLKEEENKNACSKQSETINAINEAQDKALKELNEQQ